MPHISGSVTCRLAMILSFFLAIFVSAQAQKKADLKLLPHTITLQSGKTFSLNLPEGFDISVAAEGLKRVRFMTKSPDGRIFVTDMHDLSDNSLGAVYILEGFDSKTGKIAHVVPYLEHLRNPNSVAFYTDPAGQNWLYMALTDKLERYKFHLGENSPSSKPEFRQTYPD